MASADAIRAVHVMRRLLWGAGASGAARSMHLVVRAVAEQSFQTQAGDLLTFRLPLKRLRPCNYPTPQARLRNRTQESDGSIPFSSTHRARIVTCRASLRGYQGAGAHTTRGVDA